jgi:hypothetical protein
MHWIGFLLDEILFRGYRHVGLDDPLFIVGVPRSGTTHLHRVLAQDEQFSSLTMLECILAPSVTERYVWFGILKLLAKFDWTWLTKLMSRMDDIHELRLDEPEEDFLLLLFMDACFLGVVVCPRSPYFWRLARFDSEMPFSFRRSVMTYYRRCLQKHLFYHGTHRRLLSKNPSFTSFIGSLAEEFPDARFIGCVRSPRETVPSQLSSLMPAFGLLGDEQLPDGFQDEMLAVLSSYYREMKGAAFPVLEMKELEKLDAVVRRLYGELDLAISEEFGHLLIDLDQDAREYRSRHSYRVDQFGLSESLIDDLFKEVWPIGSNRESDAVS